MNRVIKFRVWDKKYKYFIGPERMGYLGYSIQTNGNLIHLSGQYPVYNLDKNDYVIQQFTGLKDKNGKEVYEGDIVKYLPPAYDTIKGVQIGEIYWDESQFMLDKKIQYYLRVIKDLEIIGNIYENPELIK